MRSNTYHNNEDNKDKLKSGLLTALIWGAILVFLFWYKFSQKIPAKQEVVTKILINFGDNKNGNGAEEPKNQEGSLNSIPETSTEAQPKKVIEEPSKSIEKKDSKPKEASEKIITGKDDKRQIKTDNQKSSDKKTKEKTEKSSDKKETSGNKNAKSRSAKTNSETGKGDGRGNAAIGNLIKGRGIKGASQGDTKGEGNQGDPLGGNGNGDSKIGVDRKLVGFIPGTMGRGGLQPSHSCKASGTISIAYTVDKSGNVVSAHRSSGISEPCVVSTSISWVKKYVKAEKASTSSTGTYKITF